MPSNNNLNDIIKFLCVLFGMILIIFGITFGIGVLVAFLINKK